jgi:hypothetical protein
MPNFVSSHILYTLTEAKTNFDDKGVADINLVQKWSEEGRFEKGKRTKNLKLK